MDEVTSEDPDIRVTELSTNLASLDSGARAAAIYALRDSGDAEAGAALIALLDHSESLTRVDAAEAIGRLRYTPAVERLLRMLRQDRHPLARVAAAEALGDIGTQSGAITDGLITALQTDASRLVRAYAAESLGRLNLVEGAPEIRRRLTQERSSRVRASLLESLSRLGDESSFHSLVRLYLRSRNPIVRGATQNLIRNLIRQGDREQYRDIVSRYAPELQARM